MTNWLNCKRRKKMSSWKISRSIFYAQVHKLNDSRRFGKKIPKNDSYLRNYHYLRRVRSYGSNFPSKIALKPFWRTNRITKSRRVNAPSWIRVLINSWEGKDVAYHIKQKFNVELSVHQAQRLLHDLVFALQHPRYAFPKADPEKQKEFLNELKKDWTFSEKKA